MLLNARGLTKKDGAHNLTADVTSYKPDIAIITETWLKPQYLDSMYAMTDYCFFRCNGSKRRVGGIAKYVSNTFN